MRPPTASCWWPPRATAARAETSRAIRPPCSSRSAPTALAELALRSRPRTSAGSARPFRTTGRTSLWPPRARTSSARSPRAPTRTTGLARAFPDLSPASTATAAAHPYSSPEVAGAAALVWAANPGLTATDVAGILKQSASGHGGWNENTGYGSPRRRRSSREGAGNVRRSADGQLGRHARSGLRVSLSWSSPGAVSYRLLVSRDGGSPQIVLGSTTATAASYRLEPGHSYSFTVTATDTWGLRVASTPYAITLPYSAVKLDLRTSPAKEQADTALSSLFAPESKGVALRRAQARPRVFRRARMAPLRRGEHGQDRRRDVDADAQARQLPDSSELRRRRRPRACNEPHGHAPDALAVDALYPRALGIACDAD